MLERIKSITIISLIIIVLYQVFDLWGDNNVTSFLKNTFTFSSKIEENQYVNPNDIFISSGDKKFFEIKENTIQKELITEYIKQIYDAIFNNKANFEIESTSFLELVNNRSIILIYDDYEYSEILFEEIFKISNDKIIKELNGISRVIIYPNSSDVSKTIIYIQDTQNKILKFELKLDTMELYGLIDEINMFEVTDVFLFSENYTFKKYFKDYEFIPAIINSNNFFSERYKISIPFSKNKMQNDSIEQYANLFFENPRAKWKIEKEKNMTLFGDGEKTVRIYKDGYIQYNNVATNDEKNNVDDAIMVASKMIENDVYIANNLKLVSITQTDDNTYELGYEYYANGLDVEISKELLDKYKLKHPIFVEVTGLKVTEYKGIILEFNEQDIQFTANQIVSYDEILDKIFAEKGERRIIDMKLAYFKSSGDNDAKIMWVVFLDDEQLVFNAVR